MICRTRRPNCSGVRISGSLFGQRPAFNPYQVHRVALHFEHLAQHGVLEHLAHDALDVSLRLLRQRQREEPAIDGQRFDCAEIEGSPLRQDVLFEVVAVSAAGRESLRHTLRHVPLRSRFECDDGSFANCWLSA